MAFSTNTKKCYNQEFKKPSSGMTKKQNQVHKTVVLVITSSVRLKNL